MNKDSESRPPRLSTSELVRELTSLQAMADGLRAEIEELRESQQQLESSRDDYVEIHDLAPVVLLTLGKDGTIRSANLAAAELFELERGALIHRKLSSFVHDQDRGSVAEYLNPQGGATRRGCEVRLVLDSGSVAPVQLWARASWRHPGVQHVTLLDLRERELDAWEKRQPAPVERVGTPAATLESGVVPRRRVLVVEAHADTAETLRVLLEEHGYGVVTANSIATAQSVDLSRIDAIISDIGLPDGSGIDLLRKLERQPAQPALALSGYGMPADVARTKAAGFDRHFVKPIDFSLLLKTLAELLAARPRQTSLSN